MGFGQPARMTILIALCCSILLQLGCETVRNRVLGKTINVLFEDAGGLKGGETVYLQGVSVGTTEAPVLKDKWAAVKVTLNRQMPEGPQPCTEFVVRTDPSDPRSLSLQGVPPAADPPSGSCPENAFLGYPNDVARLGAKLRGAWNDAKRIFMEEFSKGAE